MDYTTLTEKKKRLDAHRPLPEALIRRLDSWFRVELTYTSNALEGNTLTRQETALVLEKGLAVGGKSIREHLEATNHACALDWVAEQVGRGLEELGEKEILHLHGLVLKGIDDTHAGCYRAIPVRIAGSTVVLPNPRKVPELMGEFAEWLRSDPNCHPVEVAAEAHLKLVSIHPFVDGNGRTARLLMNMILLMKGYPLAIIGQSQRLAYLNSLEKAQLGGSKDDYLQLIGQAALASLDIYLEALGGQLKDH